MDIRYKTVSNAIARKQLAFADELGLSSGELLRRTGISQEELLRENGRLDARKHVRLAKMFAYLPIPYERFLFSGLDPLFIDFPLIATVCANCPTQREAIASFMHFRGIIGELDFLYFHEANGVVRLEFVTEGLPPNCDKGALANLMLVAQIARHYCLGMDLPMQCHLMGPAPADVQVVEAFLNGKVMYDMPSNRLEFSAAFLDIPYPQFNAVLHRVFSLKLGHEQESIQTRGAFSTRVEQAIRGLFTSADINPSGDAVLKNLCEQMNTTRWTLWRKLQLEGHTYQNLMLKVRIETARGFLAKPSMSLGEISHHLGFSTQSAFSRFFKNQEGMAPKLYRHRILGRD